MHINHLFVQYAVYYTLKQMYATNTQRFKASNITRASNTDQTAYRVTQNRRPYLYKAGDAHKVSERHYLSFQRTHGNDVLALLIKHNAVDACVDSTHIPEHTETKKPMLGVRREQSKADLQRVS